MADLDYTQRNLEIISWLQSKYGGKKLGQFLGRDNQWLIGSYFEDNETTLVLHLAQGKNEGRVINDPAFFVPVDLEYQTLEEFKLWFEDQLTEIT